MDYEKAYKDLFNITKELYPNMTEYQQEKFQGICPELRESEDERIRKAQLNYWRSVGGKEWYGVPVQETIAWLEKQGEQKPTNEVKTKFKIEKGKWYVCIKDLLDKYANTAFCEGDIYLSTQDGSLIPSNSNVPFKVACPDTYFRDWTIQDAKDGDVISFNDGHGNDCIELIKSITSKKIELWFCLTNGNCYEVFDGITPYTNFASREDATPATKEQRDLLFKKMKESDYEWDAEKKELKKIPNALEECEIEHIEHGKYYYCIKDYYTGGHKIASKGEVVQALKGMSIMALGVKANEYFIPVKRIVDARPAWSEEDELMFTSTINSLKLTNGACEMKIDWLKSLKDRVQPQPKQEWSERDKRIMNELITIMDGGKVTSGTYLSEYVAWLESLNPQKHWKPSEEQLEALNWVAYNYALMDKGTEEKLQSLYNGLKKL